MGDREDRGTVALSLDERVQPLSLVEAMHYYLGSFPTKKQRWISDGRLFRILL